MPKVDCEKLINYFIEKSKFLNLEVSILNITTIKVFSKQFAFDDWLVELDINKNEIILWHYSKKQNFKGKCCYHIQKTFKIYQKNKVLKTIVEHNEFKAFKRYRYNLVDKVLYNK